MKADGIQSFSRVHYLGKHEYAGMLEQNSDAGLPSYGKRNMQRNRSFRGV